MQTTTSTLSFSQDSCITRLIEKFQSCSHFHARFHIAAISFLLFQVVTFSLFFSYFIQSAAGAFALALFCFTLFSYFVLTSFFQTKKTQEISFIKDHFFKEWQSFYSQENDSFMRHIDFANLTKHAVFLLQRKEFSLYNTSPAIAKLQAKLHWKNFHAMKTNLLLLGLEELSAQVQQTPTDLQIHIALAELYTDLCKLYLPPNETSLKTPQEYLSAEWQQRFSFYSERAIIECKIVQEYGGKTPWASAKLAEIYHLQEKPQEEIQSYEELLELAPDDFESLFHLGILYFKEGYHGKGLRVYETLRQQLPEKAQTLITYYGNTPF